jgi:glutamate 5-kinase
MQYKRVVIKLGTSVLTAGGVRLNVRRMLEIVQQVCTLHDAGHEVVVVSSGAIAAGRALLAEAGPSLTAKQMLSAIGQPRLMHTYSDLFTIFDVTVAQVLLTRGDVGERERYLNARDTFLGLLTHRVVPIVNENDTISTKEIRLGDNDNLSAHVANLIDADLLIMLTDQPGLFTTDPRTDPNAELIPMVEHIDQEVFDIAGGAGSAMGTGGMRTKIEAAQLATRSGTTTVIAQGARPAVITDLCSPEGRHIGTWFKAATTHLESFKRWILSEKPQGTLHIDAGAADALRQHGVSLLPVGVKQVEGAFQRGVVVRIRHKDEEVARGLVNYAADALRQIAGLHSEHIRPTLGYTTGHEAVHRDRLVLV